VHWKSGRPWLEVNTATWRIVYVRPGASGVARQSSRSVSSASSGAQIAKSISIAASRSPRSSAASYAASCSGV